jgi:hypothetical protein
MHIAFYRLASSYPGFSFTLVVNWQFQVELISKPQHTVGVGVRHFVHATQTKSSNDDDANKQEPEK